MRCLFLLLALLPASSFAAPRVVASIPPVHGLAAAVMDGAAEPGLLIPGSASPHHAALKPSAARALAEAEIVLLVGAGLEGGLDEAVETLARDARVIHLAEVEGVEPIPLDPGHAHQHGHAHEGGIDPHLWLDPDIARLWLGTIAEALSAVDPGNAALYAENADRTGREIAAAAEEIAARLAPLQDRPYAVYHDAFHYFERQFGLGAVAVVGTPEGGQPGPRHLAEVKAALAGHERPCLFAEPQHDARLVETMARDTGARMGLIDPLGAGLNPGPDFYPALLAGLADGFVDCLADGDR